MAKHINSKKITQWERSGAILTGSTHGQVVRYDNWCECEAARITAASGMLHFVHKKRMRKEEFCCVSSSPNIND
jgi:hypothetical protein